MNVSNNLQTTLAAALGTADEYTLPVRYQHYAFTETPAGNLTGVYGEFRGNGLAPVTVTAFDPFVNRRGDFEKTRGFEGATMVTAGAWLSRHHDKRPAYSLRFEDRWRGTAGQMRVWAPNATGPAAEEEFGTHELLRGISLTGEALNAWLETPAERSAAYLQWFAQVSVEIQTAFRRWLPYLLLRDETILNDAGLRNSLLFYAATKPYQARVRGVFTWDVICPDSMASVFRSGGQNLPGVLERAQKYALVSGKVELAEPLAPSQMRLVMMQVRRDPRALKSLLSLEGKLVEAVLALGIKGREIGASKSPPKHLHRFCAEWSRGVQTRLRRVMGGVGVPRLVDLALVEGTAAVARCVGMAPERREWAECGARTQPVNQTLPQQHAA